MKNKLAENMLRFGTKNLNIQKTELNEAYDQITLYNIVVAQAKILAKQLTATLSKYKSQTSRAFANDGSVKVTVTKTDPKYGFKVYLDLGTIQGKNEGIILEIFPDTSQEKAMRDVKILPRAIHAVLNDTPVGSGNMKNAWARQSNGVYSPSTETRIENEVAQISKDFTAELQKQIAATSQAQL